MGLLTNRINNKLENSNLINEHALNREPVPLTANCSCRSQISQVHTVWTKFNPQVLASLCITKKFETFPGRHKDPP